MATKRELELQLQQLRQELETAKSDVVFGSKPTQGLVEEMAKLKRQAIDTSNTIKVKEFSDHKNISLWRKDGKRIGPLHPVNAEKTMMLFHGLGILLSVTKPTEAEIEAYKQSPEYKVAAAKFEKDRARKDKSRKGKEYEKIMNKMAEITGQNIDKLNQVLQQHEVKGV